MSPVTRVATPINSGNLTLKLEANRLGSGNGRIYTIKVLFMDGNGNSATRTTTVTVPHD